MSAITAAREQFAAEVASNDQPDGLKALYEQRAAHKNRAAELGLKIDKIWRSKRRASNPATIAKLDGDLRDAQELAEFNFQDLAKLDEQIEAARKAKYEAQQAVANAYIVEILSDYGKVQYAIEDHPEMPTHVEFYGGPTADDFYAIVVRGSRFGYTFEVGLRGDADERFLAFDADVTGPRADGYGGRLEKSTVNWPAMGSQPVEKTAQFAKVLEIAAGLAKRLDETLIP